MIRSIIKLHRITRVAFRCILQQKLRSILSILGVICGVVTVLIMLGAGEGAKQKILTQIERLGIQNIYIQAVALNSEQTTRAAERRAYGLRISDFIGIQKTFLDTLRVAGLKEVKAGIIGASIALSPQIVATSESYANVLNLNLHSGRFFTHRDVEQQNLVCVLGNTVAKRLGAIANSGQLVRIQNHLFHVVGTLSSMDSLSDDHSVIALRDFNNTVFIPIGTERFIQIPGPRQAIEASRFSIFGGYDSLVDEIIVQVHHAENVPQASLAIKRFMDVSHNYTEDFQMVIPLELLKQSRQTQGTLNILLAAIASVSLIVGGIGIMNIMLATVSERTREIGIRRAVGATRLDIIVQFLSEAVMLTLSGGIIGILLGTAGIQLTAKIGEWHIAITFWALITPLMMAILVGIFFGLYPAYRAASMHPVEAFRYK